MNKSLLKEKRVHGDTMFPLEVYHMRYTNPKSTLDCHWHDEMELLVLTEGKACFQIETSTFELKEGQAVFINSQEIHTAYPLGLEPWGFSAVVFNLNLLLGATYDSIQHKFIEPLLKRHILIPQHISGDSSWESKVTSKLNAMIALMVAKPEAYELAIKSVLFDIFAELFSHSLPNQADKARSTHLYQTERLKKVLIYIQTHYNRKISLSELADEANMSEGHFCRFFKQMVNKTPIDYINFFKVSKAASLLEDSSMRIIDAAMEVGFDNFSYFINIFKHYMSCTPSEYRKSKLLG